MKNSKKILILILILSIIAGLFVFKFYSKSTTSDAYQNELSNDQKRILVEDAYQNFAWGWNYHGAAIFNDGCIYTWNNHDVESSHPGKKNDDVSKWILTYGTKHELKVSSDDLAKIESSMKTLSDTLTPIADSIPMNDAGSNYLQVWNENTTFTLIQTGDISKENTTPESQAIRSIVKTYFDKVKN